MHSPASEAQIAAKAKLRVGGPKNEEMPPPDVSAVVEEIAAIVPTLRPVFKDAEGRLLPENKYLVGNFAEVCLYIKELGKTKPMTQARRRELDIAIKRRDDYMYRLGLGGPSSYEKYESLEQQQRVARSKQGAVPLRTEERALKVAQLLQKCHALPTLAPLDEDQEPEAPSLAAVTHTNGGTR